MRTSHQQEYKRRLCRSYFNLLQTYGLYYYVKPITFHFKRVFNVTKMKQSKKIFQILLEK
jgi:hypothetical protein